MGLPHDYLDHVLKRLRDENLIKRIRGRNGGFLLSQKPEDTSLWDISSTAEDFISTAECLDIRGCEHESYCIMNSVWGDINDTIKDALSEKKLSYIADRWIKLKSNQSAEDILKSAEIRSYNAPSKNKAKQKIVKEP